MVLRSEIELKLRVHNQLVGRLIGRNGATIKKIMEDTGAVVFVSKLVEIFSLIPRIDVILSRFFLVY